MIKQESHESNRIELKRELTDTLEKELIGSNHSRQTFQS
jgi:hypothetical protein